MSDLYPAAFYVAVHDGTPGDIAFYRRRCAGARTILELGCGDGRVLTALAEPGRTLVGVELDPELLELAKQRRATLPRERGATLELICADARELALDRRFDRVIVPHGGLYCMLDEPDLVRLLTVAARHLEADGCLIFDAWAADDFHAEADPDDLDDDWLEPVKRVEVAGTTYQVLERSRWDRDRQRLDVTYVHVAIDGLGEAIEGHLPQRYLLSSQIPRLCALAGLRVVAITDHFDDDLLDELAEPEGPMLVVEAALGADPP